MATELSIVINASAMIGGAMSAIRTLTGGLDSVRRSSNILGNEQRRLRGEIDRLGGSSAVSHLQRQYDQLGRSMRGLRMNAVQQAGIQTRLENNRQARADMQGEIMGLVGAGFTLSVPIKLAIDFESSMADVKKVVDFDDSPVIAKQQIAELSNEILKLSSIRPMSASDIAQIVALGGQSGIARDQLMKFADSAVKMGVAFDISAEQAGQSMAELRSAFKLDQQGVETLADKINYLGNTTPAAAKGIMEIVQRVGAFGTVAGYNTGTVAALGASMRGFGIQEEVAATSIKNMMLALVAGETATKGQKGAWKKLGFDHEKVAKDMQVNAEETTLSVLKSIAKLEAHEQASTLKELFGSESLLGIAPLLNSIETVEKNLASVKDAVNFDGSMNKEYEARAETTANNIQLLKNNMAHLGIVIGSAVLPALNRLINDLKPIIDSVITFAKANPQLIATLFKVGAALFAFKAGSLATRFAFNLLFGSVLSGYGTLLRIVGAFKLVGAATRLFQMGRIVSALRLFGLSARQANTATRLFGGSVRFIRSGVTGFIGVFSRLGSLGSVFNVLRIAVLSFGRALLTTPIGWIGLAIAAAAFLIYKYWTPISSFFMGVWDGIKAGIAPLLDTFGTIGSQLSTAFAPVVAVLGGLWVSIAPLVQPIIDWFSQFFTQSQMAGEGARLMGQTVGAVIVWILNVIVSVANTIISVWSGALSTLFSVAGSIWNGIRSLFTVAVAGLRVVIAGFSPVSAFSTAFSAVWGFLSGLVGRFRTFGVNIVQGLIGGIKSMAGAVTGAISNVVGNVAGRAKSMLGINSPSRVFRQFGGWVSEGLAIGIDKGGQKPVSAIGSLASGVTANFGAKIGNLSAHISTSVGEHQARMANSGNPRTQNQGNITIHFNPTINAGGSDMGKIETALQLSQREFEKMFNRMQADKLRRAY